MADKAIPNFTQIPNNTIDSMFLRTPAENLVMFFIARKTYGWHKDRDKISLSQIVSGTGLSRRGVINSIKSLIKNSWVGSDSDKQGNKFYWIYEKSLVNSVYQPSGLSALSLVNSVHHPQSTECTPPSELSAPTKETVQKKDLNISLNKGQTETESESSNPDKQTKITLTKEQDTPEKRKISHAEMIQGDDLYKDGQESLEMARIGLNSIIPFSKIANEISTKRFRKTLIEDHPSQIQLGKVLEGNTDDFRKLCEYMLADDFYKKLGFTYKNLLSCYAHRNDVLTAEPVKKTAYNTRDYNSPEHKAEVAKIVQAAENRQKGIVPEQAPRKTLAQAVKERMAREKLAKEMEELKHAV